MALSVPKTKEISDTLIATIGLELGKTIPLLPKSFSRVLAKALAGVFILTYRYAGFALLQQFAQYASFRQTTVNGQNIIPLVEWGRLVGVGDPVAATNARLQVQFDVINQDASTLPAGRQLVHPGSGVVYILEQDVVLSSSPITTNVVAASDPDGNGGAGVVGNREVQDDLEWANPIPQVSSEGAAVTSSLFTAADAETEDAYRSRVVERFAARAEGGAYSDYRDWATELNGILNAYVYTGDDPGTVDVYIEATVASSGDEDGIPTLAQQNAVTALIEADSSGLASRRPVSAQVTVWPIFRQGYDVQITGLTATDVEGTKAAITEALDDYFRTLAPFITGLSNLPRRDRVTQGAVAGVVDETAAAFGASVNSVTLQKNGSVVGADTLGKGQKAKLGADPTYF